MGMLYLTHPVRLEVPVITESASRLVDNIRNVFIGSEETIQLLLVGVLCEGHILIEDVPGTGKTTLARALATSLGCSFQRIQFTPDLLPSDVTGLSWFNQKQQAFEFRPGPIMNQVRSSWLMKSTARHHAHSPPYWKPCKNGKSLLTV